MNKWMKKLTAALCAAVLMCGMAVTAYAGGGEEWDGLAPVEPLPTETVDPGEGFTEDGNLVTRDLLYDKATNKQFITVQTSGGNTFYIVIDYDKPTDEDGEQYQTYFLNMVDEADLLAAMQAAKYRQLPRSSRASVRPLELFFFCFRGFASLSLKDRPRAELGTPIPPLWPRTIFIIHLEQSYRTCSGMSTDIMRCRSDHSCRAMLWLPRTRRAGSFPQMGCQGPRFSEVP